MIWLRRHWLRLISCVALLAAVPACSTQKGNSTGPTWSAGDAQIVVTGNGSMSVILSWQPAIEVNGGTIQYQVLGTVGAAPVDSGKETPQGTPVTGLTTTLSGLTSGPWLFQIMATDGFGNSIVSSEYAGTVP